MAVDVFLKIGDIKGESKDHKHKDEIDVLSWSWGVTQTGTMGRGGGGGGGKANVNDLSFTKFSDTATTNLFLTCCNGKHYDKAVLTVRKAGEKPVEFLKITMNEVFISSFQTAGSGSGDSLVQEHVSLNFAKVKVEYTPQKQDGTGGATMDAGWNVSENKKL